MTLLSSNIQSLMGDRPAAVFGYGVSGRAVADLLSEKDLPYRVYDEHLADAGVFDEFDEKRALKHKLVITSPGFPQNHRWLIAARNAGCNCMNEMDFASLFWDRKVIAVTGTNGKTTLTEFLAFALKKQGVHAVAAGNNGLPFSRLAGAAYADCEIAVCEISSFQCETLLRFACHALLWTNFSEDHLDRHPSLESYFKSKLNGVSRLRHRVFIVGGSVGATADELGIKLPGFVDVVKPSQDVPLFGGAPSYAKSHPQHENICLAYRYWKRAGYPEASLAAAARQFTPRQHCFKKVCEVGLVNFWNDSKATNFAASLAALAGFPEPVLWIGGGKSKGGQIKKFARDMAGKVKAAFLIGETAPTMAGELGEAGVPVKIFDSLQNAVSAAFESASPCESVLFSPGFSSQDMFESYSQRGNFFEKAVLSLKNCQLND